MLLHVFQCLRLSHLGYTKTTTGQIVNLMSNDVNKIVFVRFLFVLTTARQTEKSEVTGSIPGQAHTFVEIENEIFSMVIYSPFADSRNAVAFYWRRYGNLVLVNHLGGINLPRRIEVGLIDSQDVTIAVNHSHTTITQLQQQLFLPIFGK